VAAVFLFIMSAIGSVGGYWYKARGQLRLFYGLWLPNILAIAPLALPRRYLPRLGPLHPLQLALAPGLQASVRVVLTLAVALVLIGSTIFKVRAMMASVITVVLVFAAMDEELLVCCTESFGMHD
jgi:hypothetical protein